MSPRVEQISIDEIHKTLSKKRSAILASTKRASMPDFIMVVEPKECFSISHSSDLEFVRDKKEFWNYLKKNVIPIFSIPRGGGIMWHGPGQVMLCPVVDLIKLNISIKDYKDYLERACLETISDFGINAITNHYKPGSQGVWTKDLSDGLIKKLSFLGYNESRGIVIHGCAINVSPDLHASSLIYPCNLEGIEITSMKQILGTNTPSVQAVGQALVSNFTQMLNS